MPKLPDYSSGIPFGGAVRKDLFPGEDAFFKSNPHVSGMAAEDDRVILNPYSTLSDEEKQSVVANEAARIYMRNSQARPNFLVTEDQKKSFAATPYANDEQALRETLAARIYSGDPSVGKATPEQTAYVNNVLRQQEQRRRPALESWSDQLRKAAIDEGIVEPNLLETAQQQYPVLQGLDIGYKYNPTPDRGYLEFYPPDEPGSPEFPRPQELPMGKPGLEVYREDTRPIDILGDVTSHHLINTDPIAGAHYRQFERSLQPWQQDILKEQYQYAQENLGEKRPYEQWREMSGLPGYFRGYPFKQWDEDFNQKVYTPEQRKQLDNLMKYLSTSVREPSKSTPSASLPDYAAAMRREAIDAGILDGTPLEQAQNFERFDVLPLADYADGSLGFAVPQKAMDAWSAAQPYIESGAKNVLASAQDPTSVFSPSPALTALGVVQSIPDAVKEIPGAAQEIWKSISKLGKAAQHIGGSAPHEEIMPTWQDALNVAGLEMGGGLAVPRPKGSIGVFGGPRAKTFPKRAHEFAKDMQGQGFNRDQILKQTGMFQGIDDVWRFEINDSIATAKIKQMPKYEGGKSVKRLGDIVDHPDLFKAYPDMKDIQVVFYKTDPAGPLAEGTVGGYLKKGTIINGKPAPEAILVQADSVPEALNFALHEAQHGVQYREGMAVGGRSSELTREQYRRNAAEVEARKVQKRQHYTPQQRIDEPPWWKEEYSPSEQIVTLEGEGMAAGKTIKGYHGEYRGSPADLTRRAAHADTIMSSPQWLRNELRRNDTATLPGFNDGRPSQQWKASRVYRSDPQGAGQPIRGFRNFVSFLRTMAERDVPGGVAARDKNAYIVMGYPAAGKSTWSNQIRDLKRAPIADLDEARLRIPEHYDAYKVHDEAAMVTDELIRENVKKGKNFVWPELGRSVEEIAGPIGRLKKRGYKVTVVHVDVDPTVAKEWAIKRATDEQGNITGRTVNPSIYKTLKAGDVYKHLKRQGIADEYSQIRWNEQRGAWQISEQAPGLKGLTIPEAPRGMGTRRAMEIPPKDANVRRAGRGGKGKQVGSLSVGSALLGMGLISPKEAQAMETSDFERRMREDLGRTLGEPERMQPFIHPIDIEIQKKYDKYQPPAMENLPYHPKRNA